MRSQPDGPGLLDGCFENGGRDSWVTFVAVGSDLLQIDGGGHDFSAVCQGVLVVSE